MPNIHLQEALTSLDSLRTKAKKAEEAGQRVSINPKAIDVAEAVAKNLYGDHSERISLQEAMTTTDAMKLIPKVIEGKLREAAEPEYLASRFFKEVQVDEGSALVYVIPTVGELIAHEVGEGSTYQESNLDYNTLENATLQIKVKKFGVKVSITEEALMDSTWDILGQHTHKMGRAMARIKEEQAFNAFRTHGHVIFDNMDRTVNPSAGTTGLGKDGNYNDTLSVEDLLDMALAMMGEGFNPTDIIMHPLTWVVFARNGMIGNGLTYGAFGGNMVHPNGAIQGTPAAFGMQNSGDGQKFIIDPSQVQNRLPFGLAINLSPWIKFDKLNKRFDAYCIDRNEVGVIAKKEGMSMDDWMDPERDVKFMKCKERYGIGVSNNGRAITVCKNIAVAPSYPAAPVINITNTPVESK